MEDLLITDDVVSNLEKLLSAEFAKHGLSSNISFYPEGSYFSHSDLSINIDIRSILVSNLIDYENVSFEDHCKLVLLHEIGYAKDPFIKESRKIKNELVARAKNEPDKNDELLDLYMETLIASEMTAWNYAEVFFENKKVFNKISSTAIEQYIDCRSYYKNKFFSHGEEIISSWK